MTSRPAALYIGLMSGTSTDGVDAVLADFSDPRHLHILASVSRPMPAALRTEFLALNIAGDNELVRAAHAANELAALYASATQELLTLVGASPLQIQAIGAHGQTVRHDPGSGYTIQINAPAVLAARTGIAVIADFRTRDVAEGGQGAPLVPAFHAAMFAGDQACAVLNLGGIANITLLEPGQPIRGFDTGPANVLLDLWAQEKIGKPYDDGGQWAASGTSDADLLDFLVESEPWFAVKPPKSTGRDLFNMAWLAQRLERFDMKKKGLANNDIQATLQCLTARTIAAAVTANAPQTGEVLVCGGGALNDGLIQDLRKALPCPVRLTSSRNVPVQLVEALAFAWLAWAHEQGHPTGLPSVTGARRPSVLGCKYPA